MSHSISRNSAEVAATCFYTQRHCLFPGQLWLIGRNVLEQPGEHSDWVMGHYDDQFVEISPT